jgi:hypothetical protein
VLEVVRADPRSVEVAFGVEVDLPAVAVLGIEDGEVVGSGGLAWGGGKCWLWFAMPGTKPGYSVPVFRAAKRLLKQAVQLGESTVFTPRDDAFPRSEKLLRMLGFKQTGESIATLGREMELWRWDK